MHRHTRRAVTLATAGAATASIAALLAAGHPAIADPGGSSAFGMSATGAAPLPPQPTVSSPDGKPVSDSAPIASTDGSITATATVNAAAGKAKATVEDLSLLFGQVTAGKLTATCQDGAGTVTITGGRAGDTPLPAAPTAGQTITVGDTGSVQLNTQTTNPDGSTTVIALRATITTPGGAAETITVASATCTHPTTPQPTTPAPTTTAPAPPPPTPPVSSPSQPTESATPPATRPTPGQPNRPAPAPTPVATHVAVTG